MIAAAAGARKGSMQRAAPAENPTLSDAIKRRAGASATRARAFLWRPVASQIRRHARAFVLLARCPLFAAYSLPIFCFPLLVCPLSAFPRGVISGHFWTHPRARGCRKMSHPARRLLRTFEGLPRARVRLGE